MTIDLLLVTYNRLQYSRLAIESLLSDPGEEFRLTLWDNASTDGTQDYISALRDSRIVGRVFARTNVGLDGAVAAVLTKSDADVAGCLPNDFLFTPGWTRVLAQAHADVPEFGQVSCWHLGRESFDATRAGRKIQAFSGHRLLRHPWTDGCGLVKVKTLRDLGVEGLGSTAFGMRLARAGYVNGFYVPPLFVEHMDYPWSPWFAYRDQLSDWSKIAATPGSRGIKTLEDARRWHDAVVGAILEGPWDPRYYVGWRSRLRRLRRRLARRLGLQRSTKS